MSSFSFHSTGNFDKILTEKVIDMKLLKNIVKDYSMVIEKDTPEQVITGSIFKKNKLIFVLKSKIGSENNPKGYDEIIVKNEKELKNFINYAQSIPAIINEANNRSGDKKRNPEAILVDLLSFPAALKMVENFAIMVSAIDPTVEDLLREEETCTLVKNSEFKDELVISEYFINKG